MSNLPFEVKQFSGREEHSKNFAPNEDAARKVAKWWCDKAPINRATIKNTLTGVSENFGNEQGEIISETGEILEECPGCAERDSVIAELMKQQKGDKLKYAKLLKEKSDEAEDSPDYEDFLQVFELWKKACRHPNSKPDLAAYQLVHKFLVRYGLELCLRAVAGAGKESWSKERVNGTKITYNKLSLIFRDNEHFEERCNRADPKWKEIFGITIDGELL